MNQHTTHRIACIIANTIGGTLFIGGLILLVAVIDNLFNGV